MPHTLENEKEHEIFRKELEPEYEQINKEIEPLITRILKVADKTKPEYLQLKVNAVEWYDRFVKAFKIGGKVSSLQKLQVTVKEPKLLALIKLFQYLGLVESIGTTIVDMLVLLLIADGHVFHVERSYELPRIIHAKTFSDISPPNSTLADKLCFLENNGLKITSRFIDRKLRNDIAHLNFDVNKHGEIVTNNCGKLNIDERLNHFSKMFIAIILVLQESGFTDFLNRVMKKRNTI